MTDQLDDLIEYAQPYSGGSMLVMTDHGELTDRLIKSIIANGGRIYRRTVRVIDEWTEVSE